MIDDSLISAIYNSTVPSYIEKAREAYVEACTHIDGKNAINTVKRIEGIEQEEQLEARKAMFVSNKNVCAEILRQTDSVFSAKGGQTEYLFKNDNDNMQSKVVERFANIQNGYSLSHYMQHEFFENFKRDANGLTFIEGDAEKPVLSYKSIGTIRNYSISGIGVDWVAFEAMEEDQSDDIKGTVYRVVDEMYNYKFLVSKDSTENNVKRIEQVAHGFDEVPAIVNSPTINKLNGNRKTILSDVFELLDKLLVKTSVANVVELRHSYPMYFYYSNECKACEGKGRVDTLHRDGSKTQGKCPQCKGEGRIKKSPTDAFILRMPESNIGGSVALPNKIAGYITQPIDGLKHMTESRIELKEEINFSVWGATMEKQENATATGRLMDKQPVTNALESISVIMSAAHSKLATLIGRKMFITFDKCNKKYGTRYLIETADQLTEKYANAKKNKLPIAVLDMLLSQLYEAEYKNNDKLYNRKILLTKTEPFVHESIQDVVANQYISDSDKQMKVYFSDFEKSLTDDDFTENTTPDDLIEKLKKYIQTKTIDINKNN